MGGKSFLLIVARVDKHNIVALCRGAVTRSWERLQLWVQKQCYLVGGRGWDVAVCLCACVRVEGLRLVFSLRTEETQTGRGGNREEGEARKKENSAFIARDHTPETCKKCVCVRMCVLQKYEYKNTPPQKTHVRMCAFPLTFVFRRQMGWAACVAVLRRLISCSLLFS